MTIFFDSADIKLIKEVLKFGAVKGVTTNPKIFQKAGKVNYEDTIKKISSMTPHLSVELTKTDQSNEALIDEAMTLHELNPDSINIKVPMWGDGRGLEIASILIRKEIPVNMTCLMGAYQGIMAAEARCEYISLFYNRMADHLYSRHSAQYQFALLRSYIEDNGLDSKIIAGSIRDPKDVLECFESGAHVVTIPYPHLMKLLYHPKTEATIAEFDDAWRDFSSR